MSAILDCKRTIERRLKQAFPAIPIAYENTKFQPTGSILYIRTNFRVNAPTDDSIGNDCYRENVTFTCFVNDSLNIGTSNAIDIAEQIRSTFYKRLTLQEGTTLVHVLRQPQIAGASTTNDRVIVPVIITLTVEVNQ